MELMTKTMYAENKWINKERLNSDDEIDLMLMIN